MGKVISWIGKISELPLSWEEEMSQGSRARMSLALRPPHEDAAGSWVCIQRGDEEQGKLWGFLKWMVGARQQPQHHEQGNSTRDRKAIDLGPDVRHLVILRVLGGLGEDRKRASQVTLSKFPSIHK